MGVSSTPTRLSWAKIFAKSSRCAYRRRRGLSFPAAVAAVQVLKGLRVRRDLAGAVGPELKAARAFRARIPALKALRAIRASLAQAFKGHKEIRVFWDFKVFRDSGVLRESPAPVFRAHRVSKGLREPRVSRELSTPTSLQRPASSV